MNALDLFIRGEEDARWAQQADSLARRFARRARAHDAAGSFPHENFDELHAAGLVAMTLPPEAGGAGASLYRLVLVLERLAAGDGATALGLGWHLGMILNLFATRAWPEAALRAIARATVIDGAVINSCASEPEGPSPSRGGKPTTVARRDGDRYVLEGRKTWSTMSERLTFLAVTASMDEGVGEFLLHRGMAGLSVVPTWDAMGMRATASHDLLLQGVRVGPEALMQVITPGHNARNRDGGGWLVHIPATYLGIAQAARRCALHFAATYRAGGPGTIRDLPQVRERIGKMEAALLSARALVYRAAAAWDEAADLPAKAALRPLFMAAKYVATNEAVGVVDAAMRIVGARSLSRSGDLERHYRDVRAGLHNPPMDDQTLSALAESALDETLAAPQPPPA